MTIRKQVEHVLLVGPGEPLRGVSAGGAPAEVPPGIYVVTSRHVGNLGQPLVKMIRFMNVPDTDGPAIDVQVVARTYPELLRLRHIPETSRFSLVQ